MQPVQSVQPAQPAQPAQPVQRQLELEPRAVRRAVAAALAEDIGAGDITTLATIPPHVACEALLRTREAGVVAGLPLAVAAFRHLDPAAEIVELAGDGDRVTPGDRLLRVAGRARAVLSAERVALNFAQRLSGIATLTDRFVAAVAGTGAAIIDTRKTTPGLRALEKYAVRVGGGANHRFGLFDGILIKDNHLIAAGGIGPAVRAARAYAPHTLRIEVETESLEQVQEALEAGADAILLDNMGPQTMRRAVELIGGRAITEASGGITLDTVRAAAESGVDLISIGALTHSAPSLDLGLDFTLHGVERKEHRGH